MSFYQKLQRQTQSGREFLLSAPIFASAKHGDISVDDYVAFLTQAYHHVKHTTPLLMTVGGKIPGDREWLRDAIAEYIEEERGHQEWILNDIAACGYDKELVRASKPDFYTELMVAYTYDSIERISPVTFFGSVQVLEGTSIMMASHMADVIQNTLSLPDNAFRYLRSHGALDVEHIKFFESLMDKITDSKEQDAIIHMANRYYQLYGKLFRNLRSLDSPLQLAG